MKPYRLVATNTAKDSENKIHDDAVARQYGFSGGLVPGVVVFAYMTHPAVEEWGLDFLERGRMTGRFLKPVYDGDETLVDLADDQGGIEVRNPAGELCAVGAAALDPAPATVDLGRYPHAPLPDPVPRASAEAFAAAPDGVLGSLDVTFHMEQADLYLEAVHETLPVYWEHRVAHPGWLIAQANYVLATNVRLGPWIHVQSDVEYCGLVHDGDRVSTRALVEEVTERKGHKFVTLDVAIVVNDERAAMHARHTAIYEPRRVFA